MTWRIKLGRSYETLIFLLIGRLNKELKRLQSQISQEVAMQVSKCRAEFDQKLYEHNRKHSQVCEKFQEDYDKMKEELEGKLNRYSL